MHNTPGAVFSDLSKLGQSPQPKNRCIATARTKSDMYLLHSSISVYCSEQASGYNIIKAEVMEFICLIVFIFVQIVVCYSENINIICKDGDNIESVKCSFTDKDRYNLINLNRVITSVEFDRLTDSTVTLPEHVKQLIIKSSVYDSFTPCEHVKSEVIITVTVQDAGTTTHCVSTFHIKQL